MPLRHALEAVLDDDVRLGEGALDVAALDVDGHGDVARLALVDERRAFQHRLLRVEDGRELLPLHLDEIERLLGDALIDGGDRRHLFADVAGLFHGKRVLVREEGAPALLDRVLRRHHRPHPAQLLRLGGIDPHDPRVGVRAAQNPADQHSRQHDVGDVARLSGHLFVAFDPVDALSDYAELFRLGHIRFAALKSPN